MIANSLKNTKIRFSTDLLNVAIKNEYDIKQLKTLLSLSYVCQNYVGEQGKIIISKKELRGISDSVFRNIDASISNLKMKIRYKDGELQFDSKIYQALVLNNINKKTNTINYFNLLKFEKMMSSRVNINILLIDLFIRNKFRFLKHKELKLLLPTEIKINANTKARFNKYSEVFNIDKIKNNSLTITKKEKI